MKLLLEAGCDANARCLQTREWDGNLIHEVLDTALHAVRVQDRAYKVRCRCSDRSSERTSCRTSECLS